MRELSLIKPLLIPPERLWPDAQLSEKEEEEGQSFPEGALKGVLLMQGSGPRSREGRAALLNLSAPLVLLAAQERWFKTQGQHCSSSNCCCLGHCHGCSQVIFLPVQSSKTREKGCPRKHRVTLPVRAAPC